MTLQNFAKHLDPSSSIEAIIDQDRIIGSFPPIFQPSNLENPRKICPKNELT